MIIINYIFFLIGLAVTLNALGKVCHELGYYTDSIRTIQRGREILKHLYSTNHPQVTIPFKTFYRKCLLYLQ